MFECRYCKNILAKNIYRCLGDLIQHRFGIAKAPVKLLQRKEFVSRTTTPATVCTLDSKKR